MKKELVFIAIIFLISVILFLILFENNIKSSGNAIFNRPTVEQPFSPKSCSDGTWVNSCSKTKPRFCILLSYPGGPGGTTITKLINNCSGCGCPAGFVCETNTCADLRTKPFAYGVQNHFHEMEMQDIMNIRELNTSIRTEFFWHAIEPDQGDFHYIHMARIPSLLSLGGEPSSSNI